MNSLPARAARTALIAFAALGLAFASHAAPSALTPPSADTKPHAGRGFTVSLPSNWSADVFPSGMSYCAAADGKHVTRDAGGTNVSILLGLAAGYQDASAATAAAAADQIVGAYRKDNPGLRIVGRKAMKLDGFPAESVMLESATGRGGELERSWLVVAVKGRQQFLAVFTSPARQADGLQPAFAQIAGSIRLAAWQQGAAAPARTGTAPTMKRYVSDAPPFTLVKPESWVVQSQTAGGALHVTVSDPEGRGRVETILAPNPQGRYRTLSLMSAKLGELRSLHRDLAVSAVSVCRDAGPSCAVATLTYTIEGAPVRGRYFFHADPDLVSIRSYSAPASQLDAQRPTLLDVLANIRVGAGKPPLPIRLVERRATDGSLSLSVPADWTFLAQKGTAMSVAPGGGAGFIFTLFSIMPSSYGVVPPPGVIVSGYQSPAEILPRIFAQFGNRNIRVLGSSPDPATSGDCPRRIGRACDAADVLVSWVSPEGNACLGSFKLLDAHPNVAGQWFSIVAGIWGPANDLSRHLPMLQQIANSFRIDDAYATKYIQNGIANLRAQQRRTQSAMQGLYDAIHANQADYEDRAARKEAMDARWDDYRRGNSYWISDLEGGKVYATDPWGTTDTRTGDRVEGAPYNYIHFEGRNPAHPSENMRELSSQEVKQLKGL